MAERLTVEQKRDIAKRSAAMIEKAKTAEKEREILMTAKLGRPDISGRVTIIGSQK